MESNALRYFCDTFCHAGWARLFIFNNKKPKGYVFGNCKGPFYSGPVVYKITKLPQHNT